MSELDITRTNAGIDPLLHAWGWEIPLYLFLGGIVAGMMIISGYFILTGRTQHTKCSCFIIPLIAIGAISLGMLFLFLDLEHKLYVWRLYTTFEWTSPMSWGAWILLLVYPILILNALFRVPEEIGDKIPWLQNISLKLRGYAFTMKTVGAMSMIVGGVLGMYTGVLLSSLAARPAWNSHMLWVLFLLSGLSSAAALIHLIARLEDERKMLAKADNGFLVAELLVILLMIVGFMSSPEIYQNAIQIIMNGSLAAVFWVFVVGLGIVLPLIIQLFAVNNKVQHTAVAPIFVLIGGLILRFVVVAAGQLTQWPSNELSNLL